MSTSPGSKYTDSLLRERGFNGEGLMTGAVCVVKTHHTNKPVQWSKSPGVGIDACCLGNDVL